jgi:hypothetical protein
VKAPSSSSGLSSRSDSTDSDNGESPTLATSPTLPRTCLKTLAYNGAYQAKDSILFSTNYHFVGTMKSKHHVRFSSELEQVYLVENFCNDPLLDLWSTRIDYVRSYSADLAIVRNHMSSPKSNQNDKHLWIGEHAYLTACNVAYHQFCLTGTVDKTLQRTLLIGIDCGYRALERFTSDHQLRRELSQRIRKSTILLYQSLVQHRKNSLRNGTQDQTDIYLRAHIVGLNFHHKRWALFLGRLDRLAARRCTNTKDDKAMISSYQAFMKQNKMLSLPSDGCVSSSKVSMEIPAFLDQSIPTNGDVPVSLECFSSSLC